LLKNEIHFCLNSQACCPFSEVRAGYPVSIDLNHSQSIFKVSRSPHFQFLKDQIFRRRDLEIPPLRRNLASIVERNLIMSIAWQKKINNDAMTAHSELQLPRKGFSMRALTSRH
jgi:hypothetical protein